MKTSVAVIEASAPGQWAFTWNDHRGMRGSVNMALAELQGLGARRVLVVIKPLDGELRIHNVTQHTKAGQVIFGPSGSDFPTLKGVGDWIGIRKVFEFAERCSISAVFFNLTDVPAFDQLDSVACGLFAAAEGRSTD